jgi:two-component system sensor histidine kinase DctS
MGLGLSLCRTVVEQHGGYLGHRPNTPRGTVFSFTLAVAASLKSDPTPQRLIPPAPHMSDTTGAPAT